MEDERFDRLSKSAMWSGPKPDAIVVLGCRSRSRLRRRLELAIELFREGAAPVLLLSGGGSGIEPEAEIMRRMALAWGVPATVLLVETASRDTLGNARYSAALLLARDWRRIVLVTDHTHLLRAGLLFRLAGLEVVGRFGIRYPSRRAAIWSALHEAAATAWSLVRVIAGIGTLIAQQRAAHIGYSRAADRPAPPRPRRSDDGRAALG